MEANGLWNIYLFSGDEEMAAKRKSWQEKLEDSKGLPKIVKIDSKMARRLKAKPGDTMVIPAPIEVDEIMKRVPKGKLITINEIRTKLAQKHRATIACPMTTGIFARIAAEASIERGKEDTAYWRVLKSGGVINEKFPGGVEKQKELLEKEGHKVVQKGKKFIVVDYEKHLASL